MTCRGLSIADLSVTEGNGGATVATFQVSLSNPNSRPVTADYQTGNSTATAGSDFTATSGTLTFAPGIQALTITVPVAGDTMDEANERFTVGLGNLTNATLQRAVGTATIIDDDAPPTVSIDDVTVVEGNGSTVASFTVTPVGAERADDARAVRDLQRHGARGRRLSIGHRDGDLRSRRDDAAGQRRAADQPDRRADRDVLRDAEQSDAPHDRPGPGDRDHRGRRRPAALGFVSATTGVVVSCRGRPL